MNFIISRKQINYNGQLVTGRVLTVQSIIPMNIDKAWELVIRSSTLIFVAQGMMTFKPLGSGFPEYWEVDQEVKTRTYLWGWIPIGGIHIITFQKINRSMYTLETTESDHTVKIWNHTISLVPVDTNATVYKDSIEIYAGRMTGLVTWWARIFYRHRHKRWQLLIKEGH